MTWELLGVLLGAIGAVSSVWFIRERLFPFRRLSWRHAQRAARRIASETVLKGHDPTLIVGIGRGGAVMGALISGCLGHRPLLVVDRKYIWVSGRRTDDLFFHIGVPQAFLEKVLLVAGEAHSGNTMRMYYEYLRGVGAREIRRAAFYVQSGCTERIEFVGVRGTKDLRMPWMFAGEYARDSLSESDAKAVGHLIDQHRESRAGVRTYFVVRHGQSTDNEQGDRYSGIRESLLTKVGIHEAKRLGGALQEAAVQRIISSPMKRAVDTAREIETLTGAPLVIDNRLREMDFGEWEGMTRKEVSERWPEQYDGYKRDPIRNTPPGAESARAVLARVGDLLRDTEGSPTYRDVSRVVLVIHKTVARILLAHFEGSPLSRFRDHRIDNASISKVQIDGEGVSRIVFENDTSHLDDMP